MKTYRPTVETVAKRRYAHRPDVQSLPSAMTGVMAPNQQSIGEVAKDIATELQMLPAKGTDIIHQSPQGANPSMMLKLNHGGDLPKAGYAASWMGLMTNQPGMVVFNPGNGRDLLHEFHVQGSGKSLNGVLRQHGILDSVMVPKRDGFHVIVFDRNARMGNNVKQAAAKLGSRVNSQRGTGMFIGGANAKGSRETYRKLIREYEAKQQSQQQPTRMARKKDMNLDIPTKVAEPHPTIALFIDTSKKPGDSGDYIEHRSSGKVYGPFRSTDEAYGLMAIMAGLSRHPKYDQYKIPGSEYFNLGRYGKGELQGARDGDERSLEFGDLSDLQPHEKYRNTAKYSPESMYTHFAKV